VTSGYVLDATVRALVLSLKDLPGAELLDLVFAAFLYIEAARWVGKMVESNFLFATVFPFWWSSNVFCCKGVFRTSCNAVLKCLSPTTTNLVCC
jgi:hypothetical protein